MSLSLGQRPVTFGFGTETGAAARPTTGPCATVAHALVAAGLRPSLVREATSIRRILAWSADPVPRPPVIVGDPQP